MVANVIRMANDIAIFHQSFTDDEATQMLSEHFNKFWAPSMRRQLFEVYRSHPDCFDRLITQCMRKVRCSTYNPIIAEIRERHGTGG